MVNQVNQVNQVYQVNMANQGYQVNMVNQDYQDYQANMVNQVKLVQAQFINQEHMPQSVDSKQLVQFKGKVVLFKDKVDYQEFNHHQVYIKVHIKVVLDTPFKEILLIPNREGQVEPVSIAGLPTKNHE